jgi:putative pyruvate formate lyase activating enzyme
VASHFPHFGEEDCLRGRNGPGTIFFAGCNLRCVFCQNFGISWQPHGEPVSPGPLAAMMLELQDRGCHNINLVTPGHVVPQILEALSHAIEGGLRLPIVYSTSCHDSLDSLRLMDSVRLMDGIVDIYLPDLKVWTPGHARRYLRMPGYPQVARAAVAAHCRTGCAHLQDDLCARWTGRARLSAAPNRQAPSSLPVRHTQ